MGSPIWTAVAGRALVQLLGGEGRAVDAVRADAAAGHDDDVAGQGALLVGGLARYGDGHGAYGAAVDQRFAEVALVKDDGPVHRGDAGLVAAVLHALAHALEHPARVQQPGRQLALVKGIGKTEHVGIAEQVGSHAGTHRIAVDAHDAGQGSAVGVQGGRGVVGFHLHADVDGVGKTDHARVVLEHGQAVVAALAVAALRSRICLVEPWIKVLYRLDSSEILPVSVFS